MEKLQLLLIDPKPEIPTHIRHLLDQSPQLQVDLRVVPSLSAGESVLENGGCDLVLMNLAPGRVGYILEDVKVIAQSYPHLPVIILASENELENCLVAIKNGAQEYLIDEQLNKQALYLAITFAIERKKRELELLYMANHDPLTGLPNRRLFSDRLERGMKRFYRKTDLLSLGVMLLDLDDFKRVNDLYGHQIGDRVLSEIGYRLKNRLRKNDTVARLGGDEFVIILEGVTNESIGTFVAKELVRIIQQPILIDQHQITVTGSIGIAYYPNHGQDVEDLLGKADQAMYRAKNLEEKVFVYEG